LARSSHIQSAAYVECDVELIYGRVRHTNRNEVSFLTAAEIIRDRPWHINIEMMFFHAQDISEGSVARSHRKIHSTLLPIMSLLAAFIYRQFIHYPPKPTANFKGQTVIVTGSSSGLGLEACRSMILLGAAQVIIACRSVEKGKRAATRIQSTTSCSPSALQVWELDLSSYTSVKKFSERAKKELPRLDAVIANAGIWTTKFRITEVDEETITTNVVSMCLLAFLLQPKLSETAHKFNTKTRFTVTGSELYEFAKFKERDAPKGQLFATLADKDKSVKSDRYNVSKLLAIFVVKQLASLSPVSSSGVIVNCVAPG
jgi:NAD(P)-dependent dehydrogenase (short-subunit alcohol dehydrogenase family)